MNTFKKKVVKGLAWSSVNVLSGQALGLVTNIILARLLVPEHFGLIGMISIFTELALRIQGAGLGESLLRKKEVSNQEYSFVFYYGMGIGILFYLVFFFSAPGIARFYGEPQLIWITRIMTFNLVLIPWRGMNRVQLIKALDFKAIAIIETLTSVLSCAIAIALAWQGAGIWSLVANAGCQHLFSLCMFVGYNRWLPSFSFNREKSNRLFSIGWRLMIANFVETGFRDIYNVIIGKQYSAHQLGFYLQGMKLQRLPSRSINTMIKNVTFPAFATIKTDKKKYKNAFRQTMQLLTFINFIALISLSAMADPLIPFVFSEKWRATIPFFQILIVIGLVEPVKSLFGNILKIEGQGGLLIKYVLFTKCFYFIGIIAVLGRGVHALAISQVIAALLELSVFSFIGQRIGYTLIDFLKDLLPNLGIAILAGISLYAINHSFQINSLTLLAIDALAGFFIICFSSWITGNPSFSRIRTEVFLRLSGRSKR